MTQYKNVIVAGNSFVENSAWPATLFPNANIRNLGKIAAGNRYVCDSILHSVDLDNPPDMVFMVWSPVTHIDILLPNRSMIIDAIQDQHHAELGEVCYFFTSGDKFTKLISNNYKNIKDQSWPEVVSVEDYLSLPDWIQQECVNTNVVTRGKNAVQERIQNYAMLQYLSGYKHFEETTYTTMILCHSFLEAHNIPYRFTFIADPFDGHHSKRLGELNKNHRLYRYINWTNYIKDCLYEFGAEHKLLENDNFHLSTNGQVQWAEKIKSIL